MGKSQGKNMNFEVQFIPEAAKDYKSLDGSIKKWSMKKLTD
jgi:mRNA-degrading endonuclease RelE of RelBE toxin-antitoxin system